MAYTKMGSYTVVPAADLIDIDSPINARATTQVKNRTDGPVGKVAGAIVVRDSGTGDRYSLVFATGSAPADVWLAADGATKYSPV